MEGNIALLIQNFEEKKVNQNNERIIMKNRKQIYLLNHIYYNGRVKKKRTIGKQTDSRTQLKKNFRDLKINL